MMKIWKHKAKVSAFVLILIQILLILSFPIQTKSYEADAFKADEQATPETIISQDTLADQKISAESDALKNHELTAFIAQNNYPVGETIPISFEASDVVEYYCITDGVTVSNEYKESMQFEILSSNEFGSVDVYAEYSDGQTAKKSIYTYSDGNSVYISELSKDFAWRNCMKSKYEQGLITEDEIEKEYSYICEKYLLTEEVSRINNEFAISER